MGFLKKLFSGAGQQKEYVDTRGIYIFVVCENCGTKVKVRADKQHDLNRTDNGFIWHKTIVDNRCFRRLQSVVYLDQNYQMTNYELTGGRFISQEEYERVEETADVEPPTEEDTE
jgi:hypothetical protein